MVFIKYCVDYHLTVLSDSLCRDLIYFQELVDCGGPIRDVIIRNLLDHELYHNLNKRNADDDIKGRS